MRWPALLLVVGGVVAVRLFVLEPVTVVSGSMTPTLRPGAHVVTESLSLLDGRPDRGDLVTFSSAGSRELTLKRVTGLPGDTVAIRDGQLYVNQRRVAEPYVDPETMDGGYFGPEVVPAGTVFVLGDNRADSSDSRDFGAVPDSDLVGTVLFSW